jgi:hypothetical protein
LIDPICWNIRAHGPRLGTGPGNGSTHEQIGDFRQLKRQASCGQIVTDQLQCQRFTIYHDAVTIKNYHLRQAFKLSHIVFLVK